MTGSCWYDSEIPGRPGYWLEDEVDGLGFFVVLDEDDIPLIEEPLVLLGLVVAGVVPLVVAELDDDCALGCAAAALELEACL